MPALMRSANKRQFRKRRRLILALASLAVLVGLGYVFLFSYWVFIRGVKIDSLPEKYSGPVEAIIRSYWPDSYWRVLPGHHSIFFFWFKEKPARQELIKTFPEVSDFALTYDILNRLVVVKGRLREPIAMICFIQDSCQLADKTGALFPLNRELNQPANLIQIRSESAEAFSPGQTLRQSAISFIGEFAKLSSDVIAIDSFLFKKDYYPVGTIHVLTQKGWLLLLSEQTRPYVVLQNLKVLLSQELQGKESRLEYIDARFEDRVYYKLR